MSLRCAVIVQPLTAQQIDDYLSSAGGHLAEVRVAVGKDKELQELAATPLMLSVLTLAYQEKTVEDLLAAGSYETQRTQVFATYVQRMLKRRSAHTRYTRQQTMHWLKWLASEMVRHNQTEFYIERMQPDWFPDTLSLRLYHSILAGLLGGLFGGLFVGVILGPSLGLFGLLVGILSCGLVFGLFGKRIGKMPSGLGIGMIFGLIFGLLGELSNERLGGFLGNGLGGMVVGGLFGSELDTVFTQVENEIKPTETLSFSWLSLLKTIISTVLFSWNARVTAIRIRDTFRVYLRFAERPDFDLKFGLLSGLVSLIIGALSGGLFGGFSLQMLEKYIFVKPNQGIWNSARYSAFVGMTFGILVMVLVFWFYKNLAPILNIKISTILNLGLLAFLIGMLAAGGLACLAHFTLRLLLWRAGCAPPNYPRFLDYAAKRILLRKVGGGYIFVDRLLLEYFASLDTATKSSDTAKQP